MKELTIIDFIENPEVTWTYYESDGYYYADYTKDDYKALTGIDIDTLLKIDCAYSTNIRVSPLNNFTLEFNVTRNGEVVNNLSSTCNMIDAEVAAFSKKVNIPSVKEDSDFFNGETEDIVQKIKDTHSEVYNAILNKAYNYTELKSYLDEHRDDLIDIIADLNLEEDITANYIRENPSSCEDLISNNLDDDEARSLVHTLIRNHW